MGSGVIAAHAHEPAHIYIYILIIFKKSQKESLHK